MRRVLLRAAVYGAAALFASTMIGAPAMAQDLNTAIADALNQAPSLAEAAANQAAAEARVARARSEGNPQVRIESSVGLGYIDNGGFFGIAADSVNPLAVQVTGEWPLYTGGRIGAASDQARSAAAMARLQSQQTRIDVTMQTVAVYTEVLTARQLELSYQALVTQLHEVERQAGLRFRAGEIASSDVAQARARRGEAEAGLAQARGRRLSAEAAFARITGKPPTTLTPLLSVPQTPPSLPAAIELAQANNPALQQAEQGVAVARAGLQVARAEAKPTVGAFAEAAHVRDQFFPGYKASAATIGVRGRWTVFSGGRNAAQARVADADVLSAEARARQVRDTLDGMTVDAWQAVQTSRQMVEASRLRLKAAEEALRGTRLEAKVGAKPMLAVLDAERDALAAKAALIDAEGRYVVAAWRLNLVTGFGT